MIPPHLFYQIYISFLEQNDCTPPKCGELSEYTDSAHTQVDDPSLGCMNVSNVYDRCGHDTRQLHPSCTACRRTATLPGLALQNEACSWPHRLPSGKDILADYIFKISVGYPNLVTRQIQARLGSWICLFIAPNASMAGYPTKNNVFFGNI